MTFDGHAKEYVAVLFRATGIGTLTHDHVGGVQIPFWTDHVVLQVQIHLLVKGDVDTRTRVQMEGGNGV